MPQQNCNYDMSMDWGKKATQTTPSQPLAQQQGGTQGGVQAYQDPQKMDWAQLLQNYDPNKGQIKYQQNAQGWGAPTQAVQQPQQQQPQAQVAQPQQAMHPLIASLLSYFGGMTGVSAQTPNPGCAGYNLPYYCQGMDVSPQPFPISQQPCGLRDNPNCRDYGPGCAWDAGHGGNVTPAPCTKDLGSHHDCHAQGPNIPTPGSCSIDASRIADILSRFQLPSMPATITNWGSSGASTNPAWDSMLDVNQCVMQNLRYQQ
jgi:hypothetical protein